jgi:hypothetical protein
MLRADNAKVEWESARKRWEVHIQVGAEVIKRPIPKPVTESGEQGLKEQAVQTARDEGYELDAANVAVVQSPDGHTA